MIVTQDDETIDQILSSVESICKKYPEKYPRIKTLKE